MKRFSGQATVGSVTVKFVAVQGVLEADFEFAARVERAKAEAQHRAEQLQPPPPPRPERALWLGNRPDMVERDIFALDDED
jgi:hypothetical protein